MIGANPRGMSAYMKTDIKRIVLIEVIEADVFPHMSNPAVREEIRGVVSDPRYQLPPEEFRAEIQKDKSLQNLILVIDELYQGQCDLMINDLKDRLKSRPYIFKQAKPISIDIPRVIQLKHYEAEQKALNPEFNLASLLPEK